MIAITKQSYLLVNPALKENKVMVLTVCPTVLGKLAPQNDAFHFLKMVINMAKAIKESTLFHLDLRGDPLVDKRPTKYSQFVRQSNGPNTMKFSYPTILWVN